MNQFNTESINQPYEISGGYIHLLDDQIRIRADYPNTILITDLKELHEQLEFDEQGASALEPRLEANGVSQEDFRNFQESIDVRRELLGLIMVDIVGIPVDRLPEHTELVDAFCADYIYHN